VRIVTAHQHPNFSGEWILNREACTLSPGADGVMSGVWRINHREPVFRHKAMFATSGDPIQFEYELRSGAPDTVSSQGETTTTSSLRWDGDALVVSMRTTHAHGGMSIVFRHELINDGQRLRTSEQLRGTDHDQDNIWVFDRRS